MRVILVSPLKSKRKVYSSIWIHVFRLGVNQVIEYQENYGSVSKTIYEEAEMKLYDYQTETSIRKIGDKRK